MQHPAISSGEVVCLRSKRGLHPKAAQCVCARGQYSSALARLPSHWGPRLQGLRMLVAAETGCLLPVRARGSGREVRSYARPPLGGGMRVEERMEERLHTQLLPSATATFLLLLMQQLGSSYCCPWRSRPILTVQQHKFM